MTKTAIIWVLAAVVVVGAALLVAYNQGMLPAFNNASSGVSDEELDAGLAQLEMQTNAAAEASASAGQADQPVEQSSL